MSRPSVRSGLEALEAMGVVVSRRGAGTFIAEGPPDLGIEPLSLLASLHRLTAAEMFEARLVLEVGVAGLAARHASAERARDDGRRGDRDVRLARGPEGVPASTTCASTAPWPRAAATACWRR